MTYGITTTYGSRSCVGKLLQYISNLHKKGFYCVNMTMGLSKDLKKKGLLL